MCDPIEKEIIFEKSMPPLFSRLLGLAPGTGLVYRVGSEARLRSLAPRLGWAEPKKILLPLIVLIF